MAAAVVFVGGLIQSFVAGLQPAHSVPLLAAGIAGVISLFGIYFNRRADRIREIAASLRPKKAEVYEEFMRFWVGALMAVKDGKAAIEVADDEFRNFFATFTQKLIVWGSDDVIREYRTFRRIAQQESGSLRTMIQFEHLLFAIRKDLGHKNERLTQADLLGLWVNDIDDVLKRPASGTASIAASGSRSPAKKR